MSNIPSTIADYSILPLCLPPLPAYQVQAHHCLYLRRHTPKIPTPEDSRSLFLVNVPVDSTPAHFRAIFKTLVGAGRFESITFENDPNDVVPTPILALESEGKKGKKRKRGLDVVADDRDTELPKIWDRELRRSGSTAVALLVDEKSVEAVLKATQKLHKSGKGKYLIWGEGTEDKIPKLGSQRYLAHQKLRYPAMAVLQASVDAFMTDFNEKEEELARLAKRQQNVPDGDGFVTVSRGGRTGPARREAAEAKRKEMAEKEERRRAEMGNFYRFQMREKRKAEQGELARAFEEDKRRVEGMKEKRGRFRPEK